MNRLVPALFVVVVALVAPTVPAADAQLGPAEAIPVADGSPDCGAVPVAGGPVVADDGVLKVSSYNVLHSDTDEGDVTLAARLGLAADTLVASGVDVVGMQEVTRNINFDGGPDNAEYPQKHGYVAQRFAQALSERTGATWHWCFFRSNPHVPGTPDIQQGGGNPLDDAAAAMANFPDEGDFSEGLAIVSRFPIEDARSRRLAPRSYEAAACFPPDPLGCNLPGVFDSRQVLWARIGAPGSDVDLFNTHIAHGLTPLSDATKLAQIHQILAVIEMWSDPATPDFFTGDFNSEPDSLRIETVRDAGFTDSYAASGATECGTGTESWQGCTGDQQVFTADPTPTASERIDYVFARGCDTDGSEVIGTNPALQSNGSWLWPSDHLGITSTFDC